MKHIDSETIKFHGHLCPGLAIGYRASLVAMAKLSFSRSSDEEIIAIVENDSCSVDAVQWLTGCTFGKGNLIFHDYGKQVFTFAVRPKSKTIDNSEEKGRAIRLALRTEGKRFDNSTEGRSNRINWLVNAKDDDVFDIKEFQMDMPSRARIHESIICDNCGESTMVTRLRQVGDKNLCIPCSVDD